MPPVVAKVNALAAAGLAQRARGRSTPPPFCASQGRARCAIAGGGKPVGAGRLARDAGDQAAFRASPEFDGDTLALAAALVDDMQLGKRADPDLLAISLSATDYVGHTYGTEGEEMCLQLTELDREIGDFLDVLDSRGIDYAVALTADHGGNDVPERERLAGVADAARVDPALNVASMGKALVARLGLSGPGLLGDGSYGDIYLDRGLRAADRARLLQAAVAAYRAHPQVEAVFTASQIAAHSRPDDPTRKLEPDPARPRELSGRALGRLLRRPQARRHADREHQPRHVATHGIAVGLRPARADPVLATGHIGHGRRAFGRDDRHHADPGGA